MSSLRRKTMKKLLLAVVAMLALNTGSALAETKGYDQKTVIDNDRVRVMIVTWKPGAESPSVARELDRVVHAVKGGTIVRKYEDGTTKRFSYKDGDVVYADKPEDKQKYSIKNVGKSTIVLQATFLK
jgi:hypothetical protein